MTLIEALRATLRRLHYSPRTEEAYVHWTREYVRFHRMRHPREMGAPELTAFLNDLAVRRRTSASTQNQALCALVFLYRKVLELDVPRIEGLERARRPVRLPAVLSRRDVGLHHRPPRQGRPRSGRPATRAGSRRDARPARRVGAPSRERPHRRGVWLFCVRGRLTPLPRFRAPFPRQSRGKGSVT